MFEILVTSSTIFRSDVRFFPHEFPPWKWTERIIQSVLTAHCSVILSSDSAETTSIKIFNFLPKFFDVEFFIKSKQDGRPGHPGEGCLQDQAVVWNGARQRMPRCHQRCPRAASDRIQKLGQGLHLRLRLWTGDYVYLQALPSGPLFYFFTSPSLPALHSLHCPLLGVPLTLVVGLCRTSTWMCSLQEHVPTLWASTPRGPNQTQLNRPIPMPNNFCIFGLILLKEFYF